MTPDSRVKDADPDSCKGMKTAPQVGETKDSYIQPEPESIDPNAKFVPVTVQFEVHAIITRKANGKWGVKYHIPDDAVVPEGVTRIIERIKLPDAPTLWKALWNFAKELLDKLTGE